MDLSRNFFRLRTAIPLFAAILAVALLYAPSIITLWKKWVLWDQDLAHALPTLALMLILLSRRSFTTNNVKIAKTLGYWLQMAALFGCSLMWYLFESLSIGLPAYFLIIVILCLLISTSLSPQTLRATLPYLGMIVFTIPIWSELTNVLVELSSSMVGYAVRLSNLTALLDGNSIFLPSGTIYIADGCSGLRYLTVALLMGYILILINHYRLTSALITLAVAILLGLIANWVRIYLLVLIGYHTEMQSSLMRDHETFGWIIFAGILLPSIYFSPVSKQVASSIEIPRHPSLLPLLPLLIGPLLLQFTPSPSANQQPLNLNHLSAYTAHNQGLVGANLLVDIANREKRLVTIDQHIVQIDLFTQVPKDKREEIVPYIGRVIDSAIWTIEKRQQLESSAGKSVDVEIYKRIGNSARILVTTEYIVGKYHTTSYLEAKLLQIIAKATGNSYFGLLIIQTNCADDCSAELLALPPILDTVNQLQEN